MVGNGQTAFVDAFFPGGYILSLGELDDFRIDENSDGTVFDGADEKDTQGDADLGGG